MAAAPFNPAAPVAARRGWFSRNWKWFVPLVLVLAAASGAAIALAPHYARRNSTAFQMIVVELRRNPRVVKLVGEPADVGNFLRLPAGEKDDGLRKASFTFPWAGPDGKVEVSSQAREVSGKWGISSLEMVTADGTKVNLTGDVQDSGSDTPVFDPNAAKSSIPDAKPKAGDMKVEIPDLPPPPQ